MSFVDEDESMVGGLNAYSGLDGGSDAPMHDEAAAPADNVGGNKAGKDANEEGEDNDEGEEIQQGKRISDDSSEEEEEDEEAERKVREGFIVDEEEEEEGEDDEERSHRKKRRKHKHRKHRHRREDEEDEDLDEDDLELLEENTGARVGRSRLTRLRRGRIGSGDEEGESSDEGIDERNIIGVGAREISDIQDIWNDDRAGGAREDDDEMDMDDFIDDEEDEEEGAGAMAEEEREERRRERRRQEKERRKMLKGRPELAGIDATAWDEIIDVFGDGHDYDWALLADDDQEIADEAEKKLDMKYRDVFEPSEISKRFLTEDDDLIRAQDVPERMQLAVTTLDGSITFSHQEPLSEADAVDAASWVTPRLGGSKELDFFKSDGRYHHLLHKLVEAVTEVLKYLFVQRLEVPFIYAHRRDYITYYDLKQPRASRVELLGRNDLWRIYELGQKYQSLRQRLQGLQETYKHLNVQDEYYEQHLKGNIDSVDVVSDITQWLALKHKGQKKGANDLNFEFHDDHEEDDQQGDGKKLKLPSRGSRYELTKRSIVSKLAEGYGIKPHEIAINFMSHSGHSVHFVEDQDVPPLAYAEQFADPDPSKALPPEELLRQARIIITTELGADPMLRRHVRDLYKNFAEVSIFPTDKGKSKIDEYHTFYAFKYLMNKSVVKMLTDTQFLHILRAEKALLVTVSITLPKDIRQAFVNQLLESFSSDSFSETAKAWNEERAQVIEEVVNEFLFPSGVRWVREYVRDEAEECLAKICGDALFEKINVAPFRPSQLEVDEIPSVLAVSHGKGDPRKDEVNLVFVDEAGRVREHHEIDNLVDQKCLEKLADFIRRRKPDVIVVGGLSINTAKLSTDLKKKLEDLSVGSMPAANEVWGDNNGSDAVFSVPVIFVQDEVARLAQHSTRLEKEFQAYSQTARYCIGLARYAQHPLNEYAALGEDLTAITFDDVAQPLVPRQKLLKALERALVDVTNAVGVDINRAVNEKYYAALLPHIAGLGPRKATALLGKIAQIGGTLVNREQFIKQSVLTTNLFMNAAGFLRIAQDPDYKAPKGREIDYSNLPDPLDDTRIHPEDYDLARKMATDALELDEEDIHDENPSMVVTQIMKDHDKVKKLEELNLDEFALNMQETSGEKKRHTLNVIRSELIRPFGELRPRFAVPEPWDVLTMLTGETRRTLRVGLIVSVQVVKVTRTHVIVRLDSGIEGVINAPYLTDAPDAVDCNDVVSRGRALPGVIIDVKLDQAQMTCSVELSSRPSDVAAGDGQFRRVKTDECYDHAQAERDDDIMKRKKRAEVDHSRRVIKHPLFKDFNSVQAEAYLENQQPGDVIVRPSSKGMDHIAVTWKVADGLFQHIDVVERNPDPSGQGLSGPLVVDNNYEFADLDELVVNHVKAMSRKVDELMAHEKFKKDDDELQRFLMSFVAANPNRSIYGFSLNRKRPGHFNLSFLSKKGSSIQTWPVRVTPDAYYLFDAGAPGVSELCDAFKVRYLHESTNRGGAAATGSKTPYGAGRMTPARTPAQPGYATPGHMSVRQTARTPNPYQPTPPPGVTPQAASTYASASTYAATPSYGYQTPRSGAMPPPPVPPAGAPYVAPTQPASMGMNPARAAMIQNMGGWGSGSGGGWQ